MAKQTMKLRKIEFDNYLIGQNGQPVKQYRVGIVQPAKVTSAKIIKNICDHTGFPRSQVKGVLDSAAECINDYLEIGATVELEGFMTVKPLIKVKAVMDKAKATADTIKTRTIRCTAIGEFADMAKAWGFQLQGSDVEEGESTDDNGGVDDEQQTQTPVKYTVTFAFNGGNTETAQYEAGATIQYPANTSGCQWPTDKPLTMPAEDVTVTEVADPNQGGTEL